MDDRKPQKEDLFNIFKVIKNSFCTGYVASLFCMGISFLLAVLFLIATGDMDYGYYTFLRPFSFVVIIIFALIFWVNPDPTYWYWKEHKTPTVLTVFILLSMFFVWILFNPIFPIYSDKDTWMVLDSISSIIMFIIFGIFWGRQLYIGYQFSLFVVRGTLVSCNSDDQNPSKIHYCVRVGNSHIPQENIVYYVKTTIAKTDIDICLGDHIEVCGVLKETGKIGGITYAHIEKASCYYPRRN